MAWRGNPRRGDPPRRRDRSPRPPLSTPQEGGRRPRGAGGGGQPEPLVELPDQEQPRVGCDLAAVEGDRQLPLETEAESTMTLCSHRHLPTACRRLVSTTASLARLERVGGFFTLADVNYPG